MKKFILYLSVITCFTLFLQVSLCKAQGVSMSVLIPKNGYVGTPISPLSIRGLGFNMGALSLNTGASLYNMPGLPIEGLPFKSTRPMAGPFWSLLVPLQLGLEMNTDFVSIKLLGGGFGIAHFNSRLNYGNLDRAIADYHDWTVANANFDMKTLPGYGWMAGVEFAFHVNKKYSLTMEVQYLKGSSIVELKGAYAGGTTIIEEVFIDYSDANMVLEGLEISLGVNFN